MRCQVAIESTHPAHNTMAQLLKSGSAQMASATHSRAFAAPVAGVRRSAARMQHAALQQGATHPAPAASRIAPSSRRGQALSAGSTFIGAVTADKEMRFGVVVARFNSLVTKELLEGAHEVFERHGVSSSNVDVAWVPGSFELPVVAKSMAKSGAYDAVVCIGAVIQGATTHYDAVVGGAVSGVLNASTDSGVPVVFGVLTTDSLEQALDRAGGKIGNKGGEAALTAIEMASLMKQLRAAGKASPVNKTA